MRRYTVTQLTHELDRLIAARYPLLEVEGEIFNLTTPASGHAYIGLRHGECSISAVCWRDTWRGLSHRPERGERVVCRGKLAVYGGKGSYQLYVHHIAPAGEGKMAAEVARRRARLEADGLLDPRRKRPLPAFPRYVGVATSLTGAALQDFLKVSRHRMPSARILVAGCVVQGRDAAGSVVQAVDLLLEDGRAEVIVVTRGGGSKQDLFAFQDEQLARFLSQSPVPVISAVGHQIDTTLADLVADVVAPTPSAAAVAALPDGPALAQRVDEAAMGLDRAVARRLQRTREQLEALQARLRHPGERLTAIRKRADALLERLVATLSRRVPEGRLAVSAQEERLHRAMGVLLARRRDRVDAALKRADALSPQAVLRRGYAVVVGPKGVVTSAGAVTTGERLEIRVADGAFEADVA